MAYSGQQAGEGTGMREEPASRAASQEQQLWRSGQAGGIRRGKEGGTRM